MQLRLGEKRLGFERREEMAKRKKTGKTRLIFGRDMTPEEILDAIIRTAKEYGIPFKDDRKELGIPIVDSRKKDRIKYRGETGIANAANTDDRREKGKGSKKRRKGGKRRR